MVALIRKWTTEGLCHNVALSAEVALVLSHSHNRWKYMSSYSVPASRLRRANLSGFPKYGFQSSYLHISGMKSLLIIYLIPLSNKYKNGV